MIKVAIICGNERIKSTISELLKQEYESIEISFIENVEEIEDKTNTTLIRLGDMLTFNQIDDRLSMLDLNAIDDVKYIPDKEVYKDVLVKKMNKQDIRKNNNIVNQKIKNYKR